MAMVPIGVVSVMAAVVEWVVPWATEPIPTIRVPSVIPSPIVVPSKMVPAISPWTPSERVAHHVVPVVPIA